MTLTHKVTLWFSLLLLVFAMPLAGFARSAAGGQALMGGQQIACVIPTLAASHFAIELGNSGVLGARATSSRGAAVIKAPATSGAQSVDALGLAPAVTVPAEHLRLVAEIHAVAPHFSIATGCAEIPRARGPPVNSIRAI
jgi:hypothetical protein